MNTKPLNFRVTDQLKDDFMTTCKLNCTTMTSEIVKFMSKYISDESQRFKQYQIESREINNLKRERLIHQPIYETHGNLIKDPVTQTWVDRNVWESLND